jgi:hypothetical protein
MSRDQSFERFIGFMMGQVWDGVLAKPFLVFDEIVAQQLGIPGYPRGSEVRAYKFEAEFIMGESWPEEYLLLSRVNGTSVIGAVYGGGFRDSLEDIILEVVASIEETLRVILMIEEGETSQELEEAMVAVRDYVAKCIP